MVAGMVVDLFTVPYVQDGISMMSLCPVVLDFAWPFRTVFLRYSRKLPSMLSIGCRGG